MSIVAIIPARAGSKRLPCKNWKLLNGKPLICYTLEQAIESKIFDKIIVTTDSKEIKNICKKYKEIKIINRPKSLGLDDSLIEDVLLHAMKKIKKYDWIMLLQPTSPIRDKKLFRSIIYSPIGSYTINKEKKCNGNLYYFKWDEFIKHKKIPFVSMYQIEQEDKYSIDINTIEDFEKAERLLNA